MNRYDVLLEKLRPLIAPASPEVAVRRIDAGRDGAIFVQTQVDDTRRWFEVRGARARPLALADEGRLPLLASGEQAAAIAWYPGRRVVLEGRDPHRRTIVKGFKKGRSVAAAERHTLAIRACAGSQISVPSLVHHDPESSSIEFEKVASRGLLDDGCDPGDFFRIGLGLRHMQAFPPGAVGVEHHTQERELGVLDELARRVQATTGRLPAGWREVRAELEDWSTQLTEVAPRLAHRDLHDRQVLVHGQHLWLIDFDLMCLADPVLDAANLAAHILLRFLQSHRGLDEGTAERAGAAMLDGLDLYGSPEFWARLRFFQGTTFLRLAAVYAMRPRWMRLCTPLVHYATRCLEERPHA